MPPCPHCGHETEAAVCPLCGSAVGRTVPEGPEGGTDAGAAGASRGPAGRAADAGVVRGTDAGTGRVPPFEDPSVPFLAGLWATWRESLFEPTRFFSRMPDRGGMARPILYFLLMTVTGAFLTMLWQSIWLSLVQVDVGVTAGSAAATGPVVSFFLSPFVALVAFVFAVVLYHLGALVLAPRRRGMEATARAVCYAAGPALLAVVPVLGSLVGTVWTIVLQVVGLREVHRTTTGRSLLMIFWLPIFFMVLGIVIAFLAIAFAGGGGGDAVPVVT